MFIAINKYKDSIFLMCTGFFFFLQSKKIVDFWDYTISLSWDSNKMTLKYILEG